MATARRSHGDGVVLQVPVGTGAATAARLRRFAIRADVTVRDPVAVAGDAAASTASSNASTRAIPGATELARGLVPHGVSAALLALCVSFTKGCYPGQELVARMQARGATPPYVLRGLRCEAPVLVGDALGAEQFHGAVTSVAADADADAADGTIHALCVLHRRDADSATVEVRSASGIVVARLC